MGWYDDYDDYRRERRRGLKRDTAATAGNLSGLYGDLRSELSPIYRSALLPGLTSAAAREASMRGGVLDGLRMDIPASADTYGLLNAYDVAGELHALRSAARSGLAPVGGTNAISAGLTGAASGFVAGGPIGAVVGGLAGGLSSRGASKAKRNSEAATKEALKAASPEEFAKTFQEVYPEAREVAIASGAGQRQSQAIESAITASGLRGTGLGSLASVAAGVQTDLAGLSLGMETARTLTERRVSQWLGTPITPQRDRIAEALGGIADAYLAYRSGGSQPPAAQRVPESQASDPPLLPTGDYDPYYVPPNERVGVNP